MQGIYRQVHTPSELSQSDDTCANGTQINKNTFPALQTPKSAGVQPQRVQEYPRDEWHRRRRRQTHTEGCVEEVASFILG